MMTKKKIGIVTLHGYFNYGNKLQNFALKFILEKFGFDVSTTTIFPPKKNFIDKIRSRSGKQLIKTIRTKLDIYQYVNKRKYKPVENNRTTIFKEFSENYLSENFYSLDDDKQVNDLNNYYYFITGSDQVWNPIYYYSLPIYFLTFANTHKRISYAPSMSVDKLPEEYRLEYKKWLDKMSAISIREETGARIIKELTGMDVPVLVDPTMLLTKDEWLSISKRANNRPDTPYILTYFLGGPTDETRAKLEKLADEKNMTIINLGDITENETYETGPSEFLDYINNASAFFTDSFHGVVFSIVFQTPFIIYERISTGPSMYSRIKTLLSNFDMRNREANGFNEDIFSMDFSGTHEVLKREYDKSMNYLKDALRIEE